MNIHTYIHNIQGGETQFINLDLKLKPGVGDALLFYDLMPDGKVDKRTMHAGTAPEKYAQVRMCMYMYVLCMYVKWIREQCALVPPQKSTHTFVCVCICMFCVCMYVYVHT
jgi:hypothetical protein